MPDLMQDAPKSRSRYVVPSVSFAIHRGEKRTRRFWKEKYSISSPRPLSSAVKQIYSFPTKFPLSILLSNGRANYRRGGIYVSEEVGYLEQKSAPKFPADLPAVLGCFDRLYVLYASNGVLS